MMKQDMEQKLVSVVVPVYKVEKFLDCCVQSIVDQTYSHLEILLIDDGSPDRCPELCENWAMRDDRIRVIHKENQGLGMARNTGIDHASGEYICYIDSDDYLVPDAIAQAYEAMAKHHADLVVFGYCHVFSDNHEAFDSLEVPRQIYKGAEITEELLPWLIQTDRRKEPRCPFAFSAWSGLLRRSILEEYNIHFQSERQIISEDTLYLLELYSKLETVALVPRQLYGYRVNPTSLTKTYQKERQKKNNAFLSQALKTAVEQGYSEEVSARITMLYQGFSLEAMKHIIRMKKSYTETSVLLAEFLSDPVLTGSITEDTLARSSRFLALFLNCLKRKHLFLCWLLLRMREKR